jgi:hypothetical protein
MEEAGGRNGWGGRSAGSVMRFVSSVTGGGRPGRSGTFLTHVGMLCAALAFGSWWASHTVLDTGRTRRVTDAVLENATFRHYVAGRIGPVVAGAVGQPHLQSATATRDSAAASEQTVLRIDAALDRADIRAKLEQFVSDAHAHLIGLSTAPAVLDKQTIDTLLRAAVPNLSAQELAKVPAVKFDVPQLAALTAGRRSYHNHFWLFFLAAVVLVTLAIATSRDRRATVKLVGKWLIGISVGQLFLLWVLPVVVVPHVTKSPWAGLVAAVARALDAGIVTGLVVLAGVGVLLLFADYFIPAPATSGNPSSTAGAIPER